MLRMDDQRQPDLFEGWIREELLELSEELVFVDKALNDPGILEEFQKGAKQTGRPSTAIASYLRMMYLKFRYQMSYEVRVKEVSDSLKWRKFCHLPLNGKVPDDKTLIKLTGRYAEAVVKKIHDRVVGQAVEAKIVRGRKMRVDTTVSESNIHYPTDSNLLSDGVRVVTRTIKKLKREVEIKTHFRNRMRMLKRRMLLMFKFAKGKKEKAKGKLKAAREEILRIAQAVWTQGQAVWEEMRNGKVAVKEGGQSMVKGLLQTVKLQAELRHWLDLLRRLMFQARSVLDGNRHIADRLVSLFDEGARPIRKGKLFPRTEFGRKILIQEAEKGLVSDYQVHEGNPTDQSLLESAVDKHEEVFGKAPRDLATDRGFHSPGQEDRLHERGVKHVSIPVRGKRSLPRERTERSAWFRRLQRWRAAGEGKISLLKRKFGMRRTAVRGDHSTFCWIGWGIIAHNLVLLSRLGP